MEEILRQAQVILRASWQRRRIGMLAAWIIGAIAAGVILRIPDKFEASARVYVDTQSILKPPMSGLAVQPNVEWQVMMVSRTLISRPNVEKLIRMADMDLNIKDKAAREELIERLTKTLVVQSTNRDNLYTIAYRDADPAKAQRVVQALVSIFVESSLGDKRQDSTTARKFIDDQIRGYEKKLEEAENRLKEFKLRNLDMQMADDKGSVERMSEIALNLQRAKLDLREAEQARDALIMAIEIDGDGVVGRKAQCFLRSKIPKFPVPLMAEQMNIQGYNQMFTNEKEAKKTFKELVNQYPDFEWPYGNLGSLLIKEGDLGAAEEVLKQAVVINPYYINAWLHLSRVYAIESRYSEADECLERVLAIDPADPNWPGIRELVDQLKFDRFN